MNPYWIGFTHALIAEEIVEFIIVAIFLIFLFRSPRAAFLRSRLRTLIVGPTYTPHFEDFIDEEEDEEDEEEEADQPYSVKHDTPYPDSVYKTSSDEEKEMLAKFVRGLTAMNSIMLGLGFTFEAATHAWKSFSAGMNELAERIKQREQELAEENFENEGGAVKSVVD